MPSPTILITGFEPFGGNSRNPSQTAVESITRSAKHPWLIGEILPTQFTAAGKRIRELIATHRPAACLCFGLKQNATAIVLEQQAVNLNDCDIPDNAGEKKHGPILTTGPASYHATLPYSEISAQLQKHDIPFQTSDSAGTFVCNHVFYVAADEIYKLGLATRFGFIHVPWPTDWNPQITKTAGMSFDSIMLAMQTCIETCHQSLVHQFTDDYQIEADFRGEILRYTEGTQRTTIQWTWTNGYTIYPDTLEPWFNLDGSRTPLTDLDRTTILQRLLKYAKDVQHVTMKVE